VSNFKEELLNCLEEEFDVEIPDDEAEGKDWSSMSLRFDSSTNTVATDLEIQDISIMFRSRPIK